jgi:hypothetical protein
VDGWRYTEWYHWNQTSLRAQWGAEGLYAAELYDHRAADAAAAADPGDAECDYDSDTSEVVNVVRDEENRDDGIVLELSRLIREQFDKRREAS